MQIWRSSLSRHVKVSPIKDNPLRYPGQSLDDTINQLIDEDGSVIALVICFLVALNGFEWWQYLTNTLQNPLWLSLFSAIPVLVLLMRMWGLRQRIKTLKLARDGERVVGQYLDLLRSEGFEIFHDVVGPNFNVDHVLIGPQGIFTIETKTYRKPVKGKSTIHFDGQKIRVNNRLSLGDPVSQAMAQAGWLSEVVERSSGHKHTVHPVVVFPGWFVESKLAHQTSSLWVLNPKALPAFLRNAPQKLSAEEVKLVAFHLSRYIRTTYRTHH